MHTARPILKEHPMYDAFCGEAPVLELWGSVESSLICHYSQIYSDWYYLLGSYL